MPNKHFSLAALASFALCLLLCIPVFAETFTSLEEQMTQAEFRAAGLEKLTDSELRQLNQWIEAEAGIKASAGSSAPRSDRMGFPVSTTDRTTIKTSLVGEFSGWSGKTKFEMANGQVWQQTRGGSFRASTQQSPEVEITPEAFGSWALRIDGAGRAVRVERIK